MRERIRISLRILVALAAMFAWQSGPGSQRLAGEGGRVIAFPPPPDADAIGTTVDAIRTSVSEVTLSAPASVHRMGLVYSEIRGTIKGVGWGGFAGALLKCPYRYELPYVLRIPPGWDGGLVIYRGQSEQPANVAGLNQMLGSRSFYPVLHEAADRSISDAALHPNRDWAYFAVNTTGADASGAYNTLLLDAPGCTPDTPVSVALDPALARDHALLAQRLMRLLRGRDVTLTLGVGLVQGAVTNFSLNAGYRHPADATRSGDNYRSPYDRTSGRIFDGFIWIAGQPASGLDVSGLSAPTIFVYGDATGVAQQAAINQVNRIVTTPGLTVSAMARVFSIRNVSLFDADFNLSLTREDIDWADATVPGTAPAPREFWLGSGERLRPVMGVFLDALARWTTDAVSPVPSLFNGVVAANRIDFLRTGPPANGFPYVDDITLDTYEQSAPIIPTAATRTAWTSVRNALGGTIGSIVLPETACRRGRFRFNAAVGAAGPDFQTFDEPTFLARWGSAAAYDACRVRTVDALVTAGLYDPTVVTIDVDPDHSPNVVDLNSSARLDVAIFSTIGFDATEIVPGSLRLAGASQRGVADNPGGVQTEAVDIDGDGRRDLLVSFRRDRLPFGAIDIVADVWGQTRRGVVFSGSDLVRIAMAP